MPYFNSLACALQCAYTGEGGDAQVGRRAKAGVNPPQYLANPEKDTATAANSAGADSDSDDDDIPGPGGAAEEEDDDLAMFHCIECGHDFS